MGISSSIREKGDVGKMKVIDKFLKVKNLFATAFLVMGVLYITRIIVPTYIETSILYFAFSWFMYSATTFDFKLK